MSAAPLYASLAADALCLGSHWIYNQAKVARLYPEDLAASAELGLTCHNPEAFPATLHYALRYPDDLTEALSANTLAAGDNSARGMLLGLLLGAAHGSEAIPSAWITGLQAHSEIEALLTLLHKKTEPSSRKVSFPSSQGHTLDARLELPAGPIQAVALFAHCFTCGKDIRAAVRITRALAAHGIATLRFDFTGLGSSEGEFANTSFVTNIDDLVSAADFLRAHYQAPALLIGHSLGGAAVLAAASRIPESRGIATIGAPAEPDHVTHLLGESLGDLQSKGEATITLAGRRFRIGKRFLDDFGAHCQPCEIAKLNRDLLILHAPEDEIVPIDNARQIYETARHPKSFLSLAGADHLLSTPDSAEYAARVIAAWATRLA